MLWSWIATTLLKCQDTICPRWCLAIYLMVRSQMWCLISCRHIKGWTLSSISVPVQKLSVTGNSIGHSGALLLLLQDAALLIIRSLLDGAPLRAAFVSVLLIQIFGRASLCSRIWGIQKGSWPKCVSLTGYRAWNAHKKHFPWTSFGISWC